jgi:hypothetical protein
MGKAGIFKTRNEKSWNLYHPEREELESLKPGTRKAGIFKIRNYSFLAPSFGGILGLLLISFAPRVRASNKQTSKQ